MRTPGIAVLAALLVSAAGAAEMRATITKGPSALKGKQVILHEDGTWKMAGSSASKRLKDHLTLQGTWGAPGAAAGQFNAPVGIAVDRRGVVYVADKLNHRIQLFRPGGQPQGQWKVEYHPTAIALGPDGRLYVTTDASLGNPGVQVFDARGRSVAGFGLQGKKPGQIDGAPQGIAVSDAGEVYVADTFNQQVQVFSKDGDLLRRWGSLGSGDGEFNQPGAIAVAGDRVYVADIMNNRVQVFRTDGRFVAAIGRKGTDPGQFWAGVRALMVDEPGTLWTLSTGGGIVQLQRFADDGKLLKAWRESDEAIDLSSNEVGLCRHGDDVYIADTGNNRVVRLRLSHTVRERQRGGAY